MESTEQAAWNQRYSGPDLVWGAGPNRFAAEELAALTPGRAIDLGAGEGRNAIWLAERGWRATGVDFSAAGLARAARLAAERGVDVDWVQADLLDYQPAPGSYDLVLIAYLHLPPSALARVFRAAAAAVAPGGTLLVIGHDRDNIAGGYGGPPDIDRLYSPELVAAALDGLVVSRAEQVGRTVQAPDGEHTAIDTLVRAHRPEYGSLAVSASQEHAQEQRGQGAERCQGAEYRATRGAASTRVQRRGHPRDGHHHELDDQRGPVAAAVADLR